MEQPLSVSGSMPETAPALPSPSVLAHIHRPDEDDPRSAQGPETLHKHPWTTDRAKAAAQAEISPPISPKQSAVSGHTDAVDDLDAPLPESNSSDYTHVLSRLHTRQQQQQPPMSSTEGSWDQTAPSIAPCTDTAALNSTAPISSYPYLHHHHHHHQQQHYGQLGHFGLQPPLSASLEPALGQHAIPSPFLSSSSSASSSYSPFMPSSAASSSTSLSSVDSLSLHPPKLDIEKSELFLLDTPPNSHVSSPSSPSLPAFIGGSTSSHTDVCLEDGTQSLATLSSSSSTSSSPILSTPPLITSATTAVVTSKQSLAISTSTKSVPQILREISAVIDGRDKMVKVVQYFAKVFLWLFLSDTTRHKVLAGRVKALAKQFSTTRKILRLGHFVEPLAVVLALASKLKVHFLKRGLLQSVLGDQSSTKPSVLISGASSSLSSASWRTTIRERLENLSSVLGLCQDISDDIYCLGVIGFLDRSFTDKAEPWSNRLWMVGVSIDLHENLQSVCDARDEIRELKAEIRACSLTGRVKEEETLEKKQQRLVKLERKLHWLQVTTVKLSGDFMFCGYDNLHCSFSEGFQAVTGLISGLAGAYKFVGKLMES
ncbi:hypothetical protein BGW38_006869 [Lunasporangiospora selenospora]|uniref:Uncharacterized protein n=1 Tax=Lunasporangiospora selenospora TaxID=979761 RepID=A0A9P6FLP6_9FUNG|nr:hypothetical protein BGW38_006869 [Lunasporangiospora selenospora]